MTGLAFDEFTDESKRVGKRRRCEIGVVLAGLSAKDRKVLEDVLAADKLDVSDGAVANVLRNHGHEQVSQPWVQSHRTRKCSCYKR